MPTLTAPRPKRLPEAANAYVDYMVRMGRSERDRLGDWLRQEIDRYLDATQERRDNCEQWRHDFEIMPPDTEGSRWDGSAAITSPFTHIYCAAHSNKLNGQITQIDPPFTVEAKKRQAMDAVPWIEAAITSSLEEAEWASIARQVHSELPLVGNVFIRLTYEEEYRRRPMTQTDFDEVAFELLTAAGLDTEEAFLSAIDKDANGRPRISLDFENHLKSAGPKYRVIPFEDGIIAPAHIRHPSEARIIGERMMVRGGEFKRGAKLKKYYRDAVNELLGMPSDSLWDERHDRYEQMGVSPDENLEPFDDQDTDPLFREYDCYEVCVLWDPNRDGQEEWTLVTLHYPTGLVLRCCYLPFEHGEPCYTLFRYIERTGELFGMGIAELLACIQDAHTAVLCQIIDAADFALNARGNFFYDKHSGYDPNKVIFDLAMPIPVDDVEGIQQINLPQLAEEHYALHQVLKDLADLVTASSNPSLGQTTDADKTLGEVRLVMQASDQRFSEIAGGVALQWARLMDQHRWLLAQYGQHGEVQFRRSADPGMLIAAPDGSQVPAVMIGGQAYPAPGGRYFGAIPSSLLLADVDIKPTGLKLLGDAQARLQQAANVQQVLLQHPLTTGNIPALMIALDQFLQAYQYPVREKLMEQVNQAYQAQLMVEQAELAAGARAGEANAQVEGEEAARTANTADSQAAQQQAQAEQEMALQQQQAAAAQPRPAPLKNP